MGRTTQTIVLAAGASLIGMLTLLNLTLAAAPSVQLNGNSYYAVDGNNPNMNSGDKVCASMGLSCLGYKSIKTNSICKLFHPTAKELISVNGSQAGFYCNGAPQQGLACAPYKNTCEVCPTCNLNEAASCSATITQHFAQMYVWCGAKAGASTTSTGMYGPLKLPGLNLLSDPNNCGKAGNKCMFGTSCVNGACVKPAPMTFTLPSTNTNSSSVSCTFSQKPLKKVTCGAYKAADTFCVLVMQSTAARAVSCSDTGNVVCTLPCSAPGASNLKQCAYGGVKAGACAASSSGGTSGSTSKKSAGQICQNGGDCQSGMCLGVVPGQLYECSCIDPLTQWQGCKK